VEKRFEVGKRTIEVLRGASLAVRRGEVLAIAGRSGAGKSTLLGLLAGIDRPSAGTVLVEGRDLAALGPTELTELRREKIGMVFQNCNLLSSWTALENVEAALLPSGMARATRRERARGLLESLGLAERLGSLPAELSAGEEQRVALARALANEPSIILADEPTGDVDGETAREIVELLCSPVREGRAALVVATHGAFPLQAATRVLRLDGGKLHEAAPVIGA
jgi:putative ABC transport system ATP-binding protein